MTANANALLLLAVLVVQCVRCRKQVCLSPIAHAFACAAPTYDWTLHGSIDLDPTTRALSECGGFGRLVGSARNYTLSDALESFDDGNTLALLAHQPAALGVWSASCVRVQGGRGG